VRGRYTTLGTLFLGYVGIYLCRKNLAVAIDPLKVAFEASSAAVGTISSVSEVTYAAGKFLLGPPTDRIGGRAAFLIAMAGAMVFGGLGGLVPGLGLLIVVYGINRFFGAAGWMAMMKTVPTWYPPDKATRPITFLSLSYALGGVAATLVAQQLIFGGWRVIMGGPALVTAGLFVVCCVFIRNGPRVAQQKTHDSGTIALARDLLKQPRFLIVLALSFTITLLRQAFNTWSVVFLKDVGGGTLGVAALKSIGFDLAGALSILLMGIAYDRIRARARGWFIAGIMALLAVVIAVLPAATRASPVLGPTLVAAVGFLVYGPYSLLAGVLAVESGGARMAATAAGLTDGIGYLGGILAGTALGALFDRGGYSLGFGALAIVAAVSAVLALGLGMRRGPTPARAP
jgi:MFS transporter, OPA family, glycerol-3-phosphate transporter